MYAASQLFGHRMLQSRETFSGNITSPDAKFSQGSRSAASKLIVCGQKIKSADFRWLKHSPVSQPTAEGWSTCWPLAGRHAIGDLGARLDRACIDRLGPAFS
jgi:hypothetical protein